MATQQIGMSKYEITIPGKAAITFEGTHEEAWKYVCDRMNGVDGIPGVKLIADGNGHTPAPEATAIVTPASEPPTTSAEPTIVDGINVEGRERSALDLLAAQAAGLAPARPFYDRGTPVVALGVQNARASARDHNAKRTVPEEVAAFLANVATENRREVNVPLTSLAMRPDGTLTGPEGAQWTVEAPALTQLANRMGIEAPGYLLGVWPELRARNWNQWLATATNHEKSTCPIDHPARVRVADAKDKGILARLRDNADGSPALWAALSQKYGQYDVNEIAEALRLGMSGYTDARCEIEYDGRNAQMDVLFHSNVQPTHYVAGEFFKAGIRVKTSDAGGGSISIGLLVWQNLCLNLILIDVADFSLDKIRHIGNPEKLAARFKDAVGRGEEKLGHFLKAWGYACEEKLASVAGGGLYKPEAVRLLDEMDTDTVTEADLLSGLFLGLGKQGALSVGKDDLPGLVLAHALDKSGARELAPITRASIVNAVTRYAHETVGRVSPLKQQTLEAEAGALLVNGRGGNPLPLPFMPPRARVVA